MANGISSKDKSKKRQLTEPKRKRPELFHAVNGAADSTTVVPAVRHRLSREWPKITAAERRVLALVARARSNKEIAVDLGISPATVKRHMEKILDKLALRNRVEAAICGLLLNGCPDESNSGCLFRKLRAGED